MSRFVLVGLAAVLLVYLYKRWRRFPEEDWGKDLGVTRSLIIGEDGHFHEVFKHRDGLTYTRRLKSDV